MKRVIHQAKPSPPPHPPPNQVIPGLHRTATVGLLGFLPYVQNSWQNIHASSCPIHSQCQTGIHFLHLSLSPTSPPLKHAPTKSCFSFQIRQEESTWLLPVLSLCHPRLCKCSCWRQKRVESQHWDRSVLLLNSSLFEKSYPESFVPLIQMLQP